MSKGEFTRMAMESILSDTEKDATIARLTAERDALQEQHDGMDWWAKRFRGQRDEWIEAAKIVAQERNEATAELSELRARVGEKTRERYCLECSEAAEHHSDCDYARSASVYHSADLEGNAE